MDWFGDHICELYIYLYQVSIIGQNNLQQQFQDHISWLGLGIVQNLTIRFNFDSLGRNSTQYRFNSILT